MIKLECINIDTVYTKKNIEQYLYHDPCDKYDYLIAVSCGAIAGLIDILFIGTPVDSKVQDWTDEQVRQMVKHFAKICGWRPKEEKKDSISSAIGFLEKKFPVCYDQAHTAAVNSEFDMAAINHHMKSLSHAPDIIGLYFSIMNQFTNTSTFLDNGNLITICSNGYELQGHNLVAKLFCGFANWLGHIMSDIAGSSGTGNRGSGIVIPFFELFGLCNFGEFQVGKYRNTLAVVATKTFQEGYDARFGLSMTIPVLICDLSIKLLWAFKRHFYKKCSLKECIPTKRHDDLRIMLIMGNGTMCLMDGADAAVRSGGNWVNFFLRMNIIAWYHFTMLVFEEICIRFDINVLMQEQLNAYIRINQELRLYLSKLKSIDIEKYKVEVNRFGSFYELIDKAQTHDDLGQILINEFETHKIQLPYEGKFDDFMKDGSSILEFR